ncbi:MAG: hypothetical protein EB141_16245 [Verrucomicrobia bacterium]|nr:hypothetical protein [Verrucomicrobiota bacterium]NBU11527.1 hypothetical protein [Pseudomonadota bacterium]NDA68533.1 hypothetical protein [Verrucomicrobiota bacterium]NDB77165.1 hypothetical protein [Verrucomicrobiota bacterium]NDD40173.1 hypothetical protein [Verrucomicrobiota bacterium]
MGQRREPQPMPSLAQAVGHPFDTVGYPVSQDPNLQGVNNLDESMLGRYAHEFVNDTASPQGALTAALMTGAMGAAPFTGGSSIPIGVMVAAIANLLGQPLVRTLADKPMQNPDMRPGLLGPHRDGDIDLPTPATPRRRK